MAERQQNIENNLSNYLGEEEKRNVAKLPPDRHDSLKRMFACQFENKRVSYIYVVFRSPRGTLCWKLVPWRVFLMIYKEVDEHDHVIKENNMLLPEVSLIWKFFGPEHDPAIFTQTIANKMFALYCCVQNPSDKQLLQDILSNLQVTDQSVRLTDAQKEVVASGHFTLTDLIALLHSQALEYPGEFLPNHIVLQNHMG